MYTEEYNDNMNYTSYSDNFENYDDYDLQEQEQNKSFWNDNKNLIIKIIIIILCVAILVWLILKLKNNDNNDDLPVNNTAQVYASNVESMRLAAEKYFFIDGNMPKNNETASLTLNDLTNAGLIGNVVDSNNNSCDLNTSYASLVKNQDRYELTINLICSGYGNSEVFYYNLEDMKCLNCSGFTYMDGSNVENSNNTSEDNNNANNNNDDEFVFSCKEWSDWTTKKITDDSLEVRKRILVRGVKKGEATEKVTYGKWSEYTKEILKPNETLDVETINTVEKVWVDKTSDKKVTESETIKNITTTTTGGGSYTYCPSGYTKEGNKCFKLSEIKYGDLTYVQYNTYNVLNKPCLGPYYNANNEMLMKSCAYQIKEYTDLKRGTHSTKTVYNYQELVSQEVTLYRSRTKTIETVYGEPSYVDYMEEKDLPYGYVKVEGSEKTEYSYKLKVCEK